jgi:hypothetical protein
MRNINQVTNIDSIIKNVETSFPSIFTREDVIQLLNQLKLSDEFANEVEQQLDYDKIVSDINETLDNLKYGIENDVDNHEVDIDDISDPEYELYGNEIQLRGCCIDLRNLKNTLLTQVEDTLGNVEDILRKLNK